MKCSEFLHELTNYLDGVLDEHTKVELENHLSWCHNCYVVCDTTKRRSRSIAIPSSTSCRKTSVRVCVPPS